MFLGLFIGGKGIRYRKYSLVWIGILSFTLNEGLRFGRWIDYNNYYFFYKEALSPYQDRFSERLFVLLCRFVDAIGGEFQLLILIMSFMHIYAGFFFLRLYKEVGFYALPFFALFTYQTAENHLRWYLGFSFILIGLYYFLKENENKKKYFLFTVFSIIALNIHFGLCFVIPLFIAIYYFKGTIHPLISIAIYVTLLFLFQIDFMLQFTDMVNALSVLGGRVEGYANNAERWLTTSALGIEKESSFRGISATALYFYCVYVGYKVKPLFGKKYLYAYNLFLFGFLLNPIAARIEILGRIHNLFFLFIAVILAYVVQYTICRNVLFNRFVQIIGFILVLNYARAELYKPFKRSPDKMLYVWDKHGREYLDNESVYFIDMLNAAK